MFHAIINVYITENLRKIKGHPKSEICNSPKGHKEVQGHSLIFIQLNAVESSIG